jgi:hypothetical protein
MTSASKPSIAINATQRAIRARITSCMARPPEPRRPPADELFNSVHLWRRNRDGNEESTGRICDEERRIAANIAKCPTCSAGRRRPPSAKLPHMMMDVAMMTPPVSVTIRREQKVSAPSRPRQAAPANFEGSQYQPGIILVPSISSYTSVRRSRRTWLNSFQLRPRRASARLTSA